MYCTAQGIQPQLVITVNGKYPLKIVQRFLGGTVNENPPANAGDMDLMDGPGRLHLLPGNSLYITTTEPEHLEPVLHNKRSQHSEKPTHLTCRLTPASHN